MKFVGFDFETTGLSVYKGARAVIMGYTTPEGGKHHIWLHDEPTTREWLKAFFSHTDIMYCAHNAKFELSFLRHQFGIEVLGPVWDTEVMARVEYNNHITYNLDACGKRIGVEKYKPMAEFLAKRGNKGAHAKAPEEILVPYVEQDAWLSWELCRRQIEKFRHWDTSSPVPIKNVVRLEMQVLPHLFEMESRGLLLDVNYCMRAREYEQKNIAEAKAEFERLASVPFVDSRKTLKPVFDAHGIRYGSTALGNASFTEDNLKGFEGHPIVAALFRHRKAAKRLSAYWDNFLELEVNGIVHPNINQNRAATGRMSISEPSCQNWPTDEDDDMDDDQFPVRRAYLARPGCFIASLDYSGMEVVKGVDESGDMGMIERMNSGADMHQEVADMAGVRRSLAKNGRFAKQYGAGIPKISETLGVSEEVARKICDALEAQAPVMTAYSNGLTRFVKQNKWGYDWLGRRFYFDRGFEYKAFNYRIQGGCAEILKIAICEMGKWLKENARPETFMLIPIHDEIVLNVHESDRWILPFLKDIMIRAQRDKKHLAMNVSVHTGANFYDLEKAAF